MEIPGLLPEEDVSLVLCNEGGMSYMALLCVCEDKLCAFFQSFREFSVEKQGYYGLIQLITKGEKLFVGLYGKALFLNTKNKMVF